MTTVPSALLADLARLREGDIDTSATLRRIVGNATTLVDGCTGASLTVLTAAGDEIAATTDDRVERCHAVQFEEGAQGPAREAMRFREPRRSDDFGEECRWPEFVETARDVGFRSCLALPLPSDRYGSSALNLLSNEPGTFASTTLDIALLFAAQGGVALDNREVYRQSQELVMHLHDTLMTRSVIERAKGMLMAAHGIGSDDAYQLLRRESQHTHRKLRDVARALLERDDPQFGREASWTPPRASSRRTSPAGD